MFSVLRKSHPKFFLATASNRTKPVIQIQQPKQVPRRFKATPDSLPRHSSTAHLWHQGDGRIGKSRLFVAGWNVNGIRSVLRKNQLLPFLEEYKPDFMCINQTRVDYKTYQRDFQKMLIHPDYDQSWNFCKVSSGYSGVLILTRHRPLRIIQDFQEQQEAPFLSYEGRMLIQEYQRFYLVNVYKPNIKNTGDDRIEQQRLFQKAKEYEAAFNRKMTKLSSSKPVIIFGDMNVAREPLTFKVPLAKQTQHGLIRHEKDKFQDLMKMGFIDTFRHLYPQKRTSWMKYFFNTRHSDQGWRIDYILTTPHFRVKEATIHTDIDGSDHAPVSAQLELID